MTTIPDSIKAQLDADWTAAGGAEPTYFVSEDFRTNPPLGKDGLWIPTETLKTDVRPVNDTYANHNHTIDLIVNTIEDEDRLKELADEVVRILNATAIASMTYQRITNRKRVSGDYNGIWVYQEIITVDMREQMATSASAYGIGTTSTILAGLLDLTMWGSANAAWVPCVFEVSTTAGKLINSGQNLSNLDGTDIWTLHTLPIPMLKGTLKLYITGLRVGLYDADDGDYITGAYVAGQKYNAASDLFISDATDYKTAQTLITYTCAAKDCSAFDAVRVTLSLFCTDNVALDISSISLRCYYA